MIFVTVGTEQWPFDRLIDALGQLPGEELVVQHGHGRPPRQAAVAAPFMPFPQMLAHFAAARTVVTHAGVGSILCAVRAGHTPLVAPRLKRFGEHVDDHQADLAQRLGEEGRVLPLWDMSGLAQAVAGAPERSEPGEQVATALCEAVGHALTADAFMHELP